jgi:hypothetical protein
VELLEPQEVSGE